MSDRFDYFSYNMLTICSVYEKICSVAIISSVNKYLADLTGST